MKAKITLHIYAKTTKANATGQLPIYIRLTVDGQRFKFSSKKFIEKAKWSPELYKMRGSSEEASYRTLEDYCFPPTRNQPKQIPKRNRQATRILWHQFKNK